MALHLAPECQELDHDGCPEQFHDDAIYSYNWCDCWCHQEGTVVGDSGPTYWEEK